MESVHATCEHEGPASSTEFPEEFEPQFYRASYRDLGHISDADLRNHYNQYGVAEGRIASPAATRRGLMALIPPRASVLEIGPFCNPAIEGQNVRYFDVLNQSQLIARAKEIGLPFTNCPDIDYVSPVGDLSIVRDRFDFVVACHCLEHQPDLIRHLTDVERVLNGRGMYFVVVPDKRYSFDFFLPESTIADILDASTRRLSVHSLRSILEHRALITHNDVAAHWRGEHGNTRGSVDAGASILTALAEYETANGAYIDVHAWKFTPQGFRILLRDIFMLDFTHLKTIRVYNTVLNSSEFCAVLQKTAE